MRSHNLSWVKIVFVLAVAAAAESAGKPTDHDGDSSAGSHAAGRPGSRIVQSLFRFPASKLGPEFDELLRRWHDGWLRANETTPSLSSSAATHTESYHLPKITPEPSGKSHALRSVSADAATLFRRQCYGPAPARTSPQLRNLYRNLEQRRKSISFQYIDDAAEEMRLMHIMTKRFYPAFLPPDPHDGSNSLNNARLHRKKARSTAETVHARSTLPSDYDSPSRLSFQTVSIKNEDGGDGRNLTQQWSWYPPGHFTSRSTPDNLPFRTNFYRSMRDQLQTRLRELSPDSFGDGFEHGRLSGMYWYPPGGVREWHNNYLDLVGNAKEGGGDGGNRREEEIFASQVWRMYFVRTARDPEFDEKLGRLKRVDGQSSNDHSAMHIIPGEDPGITLEVLRRAEARPLMKGEKTRQWSDEFAEDYLIPPGNNEGDGAEQVVELDRNSVWRLPDQDGYVTLFRLPDLWHCVVSEEVHRYSLGFAFSDREVQALLILAGVEFDVADSEGYGANARGAKDEL